MSSAGWAGYLAKGLGELAAGADFDDVLGGAVKQGVLNLLPMFAVGQVVQSLVGPLKELLGVEKTLPILGMILDAGAKRQVGRNLASHRVIHAATLRAHGFKYYQDLREVRNLALPAREVLGGPMLSGTLLYGSGTNQAPWAWLWIVELNNRLNDVFRDGGAEGIKTELQTSAISLQAFHAAVALQAWAESTVVVLPVRRNGAVPYIDPDFEPGPLKVQGGLPGTGLLPWQLSSDSPKPKTKGYVRYARSVLWEVRVRLYDFRDEVFAGAEEPVLKGKWGLFKRLGLPSYQVYEKAMLDNAGELAPPPNEVFPGASAANIQPIEGFDDLTALPVLGAVAAGASGSASGSKIPAASLTGAKGAKAQVASPESAALPVAVGVGALAVALALL